MTSSESEELKTLETVVVESSQPVSGDELEHNGGDYSQSTMPQGECRQKKPISFHMSFLALMVMCLIVSIDGTVLAVAIPAITFELNGSTLQAFWASISFLLAVVVVQPIYTNLSNVLGRIIPLYASFAFFIAGSIIFALAKDMGTLIAGRILQGLGAGGLDVLNEIILADITTLKERPLYLGMLAIPMAGGAILGPVMGGLFSEYASWRWIGWVNLPISALGLILVFFFLKLKHINQSFREKIRRIDWGGLVLFAVGCALFTTPLTWAGAMFPWSSWETILPLCLGIVLLFIFAWYESKPIEPVFPYRFFNNRTACATLLVAFLHGAVTYSGVLYTPLFFQSMYLNTPIQSAISILPLCCSSVAFGIISAVAVEVVRKYRMVILASWAFTAVGVGLFEVWDSSSSLAAKASFQVIHGVGTGTLFSVLTLPMQANAPHVDDMGLAAGILVSFRLFGGLVGLSMCSTVFNNVFEQQIRLLGPLPAPVAILSDAREAVGFIPLLRGADLPLILLEKLTETYKNSMFAVFWMMTGLGVTGFLASLMIKEISLEREDLGRQQLEERK